MGAASGRVGLAAVCDSVDVHRDEINAGVEASPEKIDGTDVAAVVMMTGFNFEEFDEVGGLSE